MGGDLSRGQPGLTPEQNVTDRLVDLRREATALGGGGIAYLARTTIEADLASGMLVELFEDVPKADLTMQVRHGFSDCLPVRIEVVLALFR